MFQSSNHYSRQNTFHDPYRLSSHRASFIFHGFLRLHWRNSSTILHRKTVSSNYVHLTLIGIGWPTHYLNVMDSVIILKMGWTSPIGQIFISVVGFLWTRSAVLTFCMPVLVHRSFGKMTCFEYGHLFPRALLPSALWDPDWPISLPWMFTLAIKFLRDSWVKMTYFDYGLSVSFITSGWFNFCSNLALIG